MAKLDQLIKKAAVEAVAASKPVDIVYGKVLSVTPITIQVDQKLTLDDDFIVMTQTVSGILIPGDRVAMLRAQGGQSYLVIDKVV